LSARRVRSEVEADDAALGDCVVGLADLPSYPAMLAVVMTTPLTGMERHGLRHGRGGLAQHRIFPGEEDVDGAREGRGWVGLVLSVDLRLPAAGPPCTTTATRRVPRSSVAGMAASTESSLVTSVETKIALSARSSASSVPRSSSPVPR